MPISPLHVLIYHSFQNTKNVQIFFFFDFLHLCFSERFQLYLCQCGFTFLFASSRGIGERPNKRDLWHCIYTMNTNPLLAPFRNINIDKIYFSGTGTKIKGINIENIFLYKIRAQKNSLSMCTCTIWIGCIIIWFLYRFFLLHYDFSLLAYIDLASSKLIVCQN